MIRVALLMVGLATCQVRAEAFNTGGIDWKGVDASAFQALDYLVDVYDVKSSTADSEPVSMAYRECAQDIRGLIQTKNPKFEDLLIVQQQPNFQQDFGQRPPVPVGPELEKKYPTPNQAPVQAPSKVPQPTQKQVQAPMSYTSCTPAASYQSYGSGGRWRLFGRRASGGGFRLFGGRRGGC